LRTFIIQLVYLETTVSQLFSHINDITCKRLKQTRYLYQSWELEAYRNT